ncbi:hypothetical protein LXL04_036027 [Taraxacum kok-saghyz]
MSSNTSSTSSTNSEEEALIDYAAEVAVNLANTLSQQVEGEWSNAIRCTAKERGRFIMPIYITCFADTESKPRPPIEPQSESERARRIGKRNHRRTDSREGKQGDRRQSSRPPEAAGIAATCSATRRRRTPALVARAAGLRFFTLWFAGIVYLRHIASISDFPPCKFEQMAIPTHGTSTLRSARTGVMTACGYGQINHHEGSRGVVVAIPQSLKILNDTGDTCITYTSE